MVGNTDLQIDGQAFSVALETLADHSRLLRRAIEIACGDNDRLVTTWAGESANAHSQRWAEFVAAAHKFVDQLDVDNARLGQVVQSVFDTEQETTEHVSMLDLS